VRPVHNSGTLPIICESISHVSIGCVCARSQLQKGLDSYQEEDLSILRDKWSDALAKRRDYLDDQLQRIMNKPGPCSSLFRIYLLNISLKYLAVSKAMATCFLYTTAHFLKFTQKWPVWNIISWVVFC